MNKNLLKPKLKPKTESEGGNQSNKLPVWPLRISERRMLLLVLDIILVNLAVLVGLWTWSLRSGNPFPSVYAFSFPAITMVWLVVAALNNFYSPQVSSGMRHTVQALGKMIGMLLIPYLLVYFLSPRDSLPRFFILSFSTISFGLVAIWRFIYIYYLGGSSFLRRAIILFDGNFTASVPSLIPRLANPYYQILGFAGDDRPSPGGSMDGLADLGATSEIPRLVQELAVSEVIVTNLNVREGESEATLIRSLVDCYEHGIQITFLPDILEDLTARVSLDLVEQGWIGSLPLQHASTGVIFPIVKRSMDIALAILGLFAFAVVFPLAAVAIRLDSPGPIFYVQDRIGKGGKVFRVYKLRTMRIDAEKDGKAVWAEKRDPRVTGVGRLLRATHLDEFPQLINILKGDMSAVGPRPERPELVAELDQAIPFYRLRHSVRPGLAGWAVIKLGYSSSLEDTRAKLEYDLYYIKHQSIWFDLLILLKCFVDSVAFRGRF